MDENSIASHIVEDIDKFSEKKKGLQVKLFKKIDKKEEDAMEKSEIETDEEQLEAERKLWTLNSTLETHTIKGKNKEEVTSTSKAVSNGYIEEIKKINIESSKRLPSQESMERETINEFKKRQINRGESTLQIKFGAKITDKKEE